MWKAGRYRKDRFKPRVLICDQESRVGSVLQAYLTSVGFHADFALNRDQCIELAWMSHPDVILLDLEMPNMDGQELVGQLRKLGIHIPVILFSAGTSHLAFDDDSAVLQKPVRPKEIAVILETLLLETKREKRFIPRRFKVH